MRITWATNGILVDVGNEVYFFARVHDVESLLSTLAQVPESQQDGVRGELVSLAGSLDSIKGTKDAEEIAGFAARLKEAFGD